MCKRISSMIFSHFRKGVELLKYKALRLNYVYVRYDKVTVLGIGRG